MERDDLIVNDSYAMAAHHSEEAGAAIRKKIWFVTALLTLITAVEVGMGVVFKRSETFTWTAIKWTFIVMTLVKAGYIVLVFMHLGDERSNLKRVIVAPYLLFISYLIFIAITDGCTGDCATKDVPTPEDSRDRLGTLVYLASGPSLLADVGELTPLVAGNATA